MAKAQDVLGPDLNSFDQGGEEGAAWGGRSSYNQRPTHDSPGSYKGGWNDNILTEGDAPIWEPTDQAAFDAASQRTPSGREEDVNRYRGLGAAAADRHAYQLNFGDANASLAHASGDLDSTQGALGGATQSLNYANGMQGMAGSARSDQNEALNLQRNAAYGNAPSQAEIMGQGMINQSLQAQIAGAASARGGAMAQAAAMRQAQQGAAGFQQQGLGQLAAMRAGEMANARTDYQGGATGIRQGDFTGATVANQSAGQYTGMANTQLGVANARTDIGKSQADMAVAQGNQESGQRDRNDRAQQSYEGLGFNVNQAALNAGIGKATQAQQALQFGQQMDQADSDRTMAAVGAGVGAGATLGAAGINYAGQANAAKIKADGRAKGGPVSSGTPYLVGEKGPELIVPQHGGMVIPAHQTAHVIGLAQAARLRGRAQGMEEGYRRALAQGPAVGPAQPAPRMMTLPTQLIDDALERPSMGRVASLMGGRDYPSGDAPTTAPPLEHLMGGREDPYGPAIDRSDPWAVEAREDGGPVAPGKPYLVGEKGPEVVMPVGVMDGYDPLSEVKYEPAPSPNPLPPPPVPSARRMESFQRDPRPQMSVERPAWNWPMSPASIAGQAGAHALLESRGEVGSGNTRAPNGIAQAAKARELVGATADSKRYETTLSAAEEQQFQDWKKKFAPRDSGGDYDLRGAFKAGEKPDATTGHWVDTFKKPNHPTFSDQSMYAVGDDADKAGSWDGDTFRPPGERERVEPVDGPHSLPPPKPPRVDDKYAARERLRGGKSLGALAAAMPRRRK